MVFREIDGAIFLDSFISYRHRCHVIGHHVKTITNPRLTAISRGRQSAQKCVHDHVSVSLGREASVQNMYTSCHFRRIDIRSHSDLIMDLNHDIHVTRDP